MLIYGLAEYNASPGPGQQEAAALEYPDPRARIAPMGLFETAITVCGVLIFIQGTALGILVATRWKIRGNASLAVLLVLLGINGLVLLSWGEASALFPPEAVGVLSVEVMLYGPLIWRYFWSAFNEGQKPRLHYAVHFIPAAAVAAAYALAGLALGRAEFARISAEVLEGRGPLWVRVLEAGKLAQGLGYSAAIVALWLRNREGPRRWADRASRIRWLRALAVAFLLNWALASSGNALLWALPGDSVIRAALELPQAAALLAFLYVAGFFALRFPSVLEPRDAREAIRRALNLPEGFVEESLRRLRKARADGAFSEPSLDLQGLAGKLGLHPNALSYIVNEHLGMGFREYLNGARLEAFLLLRESGSTRSMLEDALECGFSSKTSFLRAFRARYGSTPSEYLNPAAASKPRP
jgi:AraC-like DNA-binding protein